MTCTQKKRKRECVGISFNQWCLTTLCQGILGACYIPCFLRQLCFLLRWCLPLYSTHYCDVIMDAMVFQITSLSIVCSTFYSGANQRKHQSSASLAFVRGIHRSPVNPPHKRPVTWKMFSFDDVIMHPKISTQHMVRVYAVLASVNFTQITRDDISCMGPSNYSPFTGEVILKNRSKYTRSL